MKKMKIFISMILLMILGAAISYADSNINTKYSTLKSSLECINAEYEFYNVKYNSELEYNISKEKLKKVLFNIVEIFGVSQNEIEYDENWNNKKNEIFINVELKNIKISVKGIKKNSNEAYITVDISEHKVYKHIEDDYNELEKLLKNYSNNTEIYACIVGKYTKKLQNDKYDDILDKILYNMSAEEIHKIKNKHFLSAVAYGKVLRYSELDYLGKKINLNIAIRYKEDIGETYVYIASPIIKIDY
ncbi:YwmB family TATA-box binding protein [Metaclostridioides mangenotii]|uniref:YwmB family TATA-box binding protein n=1 Tax=Metaclostridioides mangenotii TaxID=1540 RepID=UPI00048492BB|nr:YwmB family TATA-box binding protein [Clostridioides mangenotii]